MRYAKNRKFCKIKLIVNYISISHNIISNIHLYFSTWCRITKIVIFVLMNIHRCNSILISGICNFYLFLPHCVTCEVTRRAVSKSDSDLQPFARTTTSSWSIFRTEFLAYQRTKTIFQSIAGYTLCDFANFA